MSDEDDVSDPAAAAREGDAARLWRFALDLYAQDGVEQAAIALQDEHGLDVPLLLLCCFMGRHGVRATRETIQTLDQHARAWRSVAVDPLRALRRRLKQDVGAVSAARAEPFRDRVKALELEAERLQLETLFHTLERLPGKDGRDAERAGLMRVNLSLYAAHAGVDPPQAARDLMEVLVRGTVDMLLGPETAEPPGDPSSQA